MRCGSGPEDIDLSATTVTISSTLAEDPDFRELVELFIAEIPDRAASLIDAFDRANWCDLRRIAHQLKGAGGGYGYSQLSAAAARLERTVDTVCPSDQIKARLDELLDLCGRLRV